jgi:hypothetical protein
MATAAPTANPAMPPRKRRGRFRFFLILFLFALVAIGGFALYVWSALHINYSDGERAGYVQKFSHKGYLCKTWEGELAMVNLPGTMPQMFEFTVRDAATAEKINKSLGQRVRLHYDQHPGLPTSCFGETEYFVTDVQTVGP